MTDTPLIERLRNRCINLTFSVNDPCGHCTVCEAASVIEAAQRTTEPDREWPSPVCAQHEGSCDWVCTECLATNASVFDIEQAMALRIEQALDLDPNTSDSESGDPADWVVEMVRAKFGTASNQPLIPTASEIAK